MLPQLKILTQKNRAARVKKAVTAKLVATELKRNKSTMRARIKIKIAVRLKKAAAEKMAAGERVTS
jgi:hypothetical protein